MGSRSLDARLTGNYPSCDIFFMAGWLLAMVARARTDELTAIARSREC